MIAVRPGERICQNYQPELDLAERWPDWAVYETSDLPPGVAERFQIAGKVVLVSSGEHGREWAIAHVVAHLDLEHHLMSVGAFTGEHEADADLLASIRLDLLRWNELPLAAEPEPGDTSDDEWKNIPLDGEPTVHLR